MNCRDANQLFSIFCDVWRVRITRLVQAIALQPGRVRMLLLVYEETIGHTGMMRSSGCWLPPLPGSTAVYNFRRSAHTSGGFLFVSCTLRSILAGVFSFSCFV